MAQIGGILITPSTRPRNGYIKKYSGKKDGCGAFVALHAHAMTASNAGVLKTKAHAKLATLQFDGQKGIGVSSHFALRS